MQKNVELLSLIGVSGLKESLIGYSIVFIKHKLFINPLYNIFEIIGTCSDIFC